MKSLLGTAAILLFATSAAFGQSEYIQRAIERKYEEKNEREHGDSGRSKLNGWVDNVNNVKLRPAYAFTRSVTYTTTTYNKRGKVKDENILVMYANPVDKLSCMKSGDDRHNTYMVVDVVPRAEIIFDNDKMTMTMINANAFLSRKTQNSLDHPQAGNGDRADATGLKELGHKNILGYPCTGYEQDNNDGEKTGEIWMAATKDFVGFGLMNPTLSGRTGMLVLEVSTFRKGVLESAMVATSVNKNEHLVFRSADYKREQMGHMD